MTTETTERRSLHSQRPSGGEPGSTLSSAHGSNEGVDRPQRQATDISMEPETQASAGQHEIGSSAFSDARHPDKSLPALDQAGKASAVESQSTPAPRNPTKEDEKSSVAEAAPPGSVNLAKDLTESTSIPYPNRPTLSSFKTRSTKGRSGHTPRGLDGQKQGSSKPSIPGQKASSKHQHNAISDCSPWEGNHQEDSISEIVIKGGYQVKQLVVNETNTARPTLGPHLKNNSGLQNLSTFFASILERQHDSGRVTAPSTFKPPPRVTLTDTKREVWLGELASPAVPLRKLSRTIPHGIRGRILLDQCMAKNVPLTRAIWLAKCVGANELRAFRRKGISGVVMLENEQKWIREWTVLLETFVEDAGRISDQPEWKARIFYALQLTSRIFVEGLLDKDHFLDWALTRLEIAANDSLPFALLVVQMIRTAITQSLKHGRRLASISLSKLNELSTSQDRDLYVPLIKPLANLVTNLAIQRPQCAILHRVWRRCRVTFLSIVQEVEQASAKASDDMQRNSKQAAAMGLRRLMEKNDRIARATSRVVTSEEPLSLSLVRTLDAFQPQTSVEHIASQCLLIVPDSGCLITLLLQWAASSYREGTYRTFIVSRLIRKWNEDGLDTDMHILASLETFRTYVGLGARKVSRIVAELMRSGHFDASRFLRLLISTGGLYDEGRPYELQILIDMPLAHLPSNVRGLRTMLLRGREPSARNESASTDQDLAERLKHFLHTRKDGEYDFQKLEIDSSELSWSKIFDIGGAIRHNLPPASHREQLHETPGGSTSSDASYATAQAKRLVIALEAIGDIITLADAMSAIVPVADSDGLIFLVETIGLNFEDLAGAGAVHSLIQAACDRYRALRTTLPPLMRLVVPIFNVCTRLPAGPSTITYLKRELAFCNANVGIAATTPMSDIQMESANEADNELERILAGGSIMDSQRLSQALDMITSRATKATSLDQGYSTLVTILCTLKTQNEATFPDALISCLRMEICKGDSIELGKIVSFLLSAGCFNLATFSVTTEKICDELASENADAGVAACVTVLGLFLRYMQHNAATARNCSEDMSRICEVNPECVLRLLLRIFRSGEKSTKHTDVERLCRSTAVLRMFKRLVVDKPSVVRSVFEPSALSDVPLAVERLKRIVFCLSDPLGDFGFLELSSVDQIRIMFETVDGLSLPFFEMCLRWFNVDAAAYREQNNHGLASSCIEAVVKREAQGCQIWPELISAMDEKLAQQVRIYAERHVLIEPSSSGDALERLRSADPSGVRLWTRVVESTAFSIPDQGDVETGRNIEKHFALATSIMTGSVDERDALLQQWLQALCHLAMIHSRSCSGPTTKAKISHALCGLLARDVGQLTRESLVAVFDTAAYFVEDLTPQAFALVRSNLGPLKADGRVRFLFGIHENADNWLYISRMAPTHQQSQGPEQTASSVFPLRRWELLPESAANVGANDTALSLRLFEATKIK